MKNCLFGIIVCSFILIIPGRLYAQDIRLSGGIGFPELINLGLRVEFDQSEFGISAGTFPESEEDVLSLSGNFYYHFAGSSQLTDLRPWFLKAGLTYAYSENEWKRANYFFLGPSVGREFNISSNFAIAVEAGIFVILSENETEKKDPPKNYWDLDFDFSGSILPSTGINLIYRF